MIQNCLRWWSQPNDPNFIGFPKYRIHGPYHWRNLEHSETYRRLVDFVLRHVSPDFRCLDLGCGDAACTAMVAKDCLEAVGIDADYDAIRLARIAIDRCRIRNCQVIHAPLSKVKTVLGSVSHSFDLVYSIDVIEHLPNPAELLNLASYFCRPGGIVLIGTPVFRSMKEVSKHHVREYTIAEFHECLSGIFGEVHIETIPYTRGGGELLSEGYMFAIYRMPTL